MESVIVSAYLLRDPSDESTSADESEWTLSIEDLNSTFLRTPNINMSQYVKTESDFFSQFFDDEVINGILKETNNLNYILLKKKNRNL